MAKPRHDKWVIHLVSVLIAWWLVTMAFLSLAQPAVARARSANAPEAATVCIALCVVFAVGWQLILLPLPGNESRVRIVRRLGRLSIPYRIPIGALLGLAVLLAIAAVAAIAT